MLYLTHRLLKMVCGLYVLFLFLIYLFIFNDSSHTNYLKV